MPYSMSTAIDKEDRTSGSSEDGLGDAPKHQPRETCPTLRTDDDHIRLPEGRLFQDHLHGFSRDTDTLGLNAVPLKLAGHSIQLALRNDPRFSLIGRMDDTDPGPQLRGQVRHIAHDPIGAERKVGRHEQSRQTRLGMMPERVPRHHLLQDQHRTGGQPARPLARYFRVSDGPSRCVRGFP